MMQRPPETHFLYFLLEDLCAALPTPETADGEGAEPVDWERYDVAARRINRLLGDDTGGVLSPYAAEIEAFGRARRSLLDAVKGDETAPAVTARGSGAIREAILEVREAAEALMRTM